jgi:hypothetical protein
LQILVQYMSFLQYSDHQSIFQSFVSYLDLNAKHIETNTNMHFA